MERQNQDAETKILKELCNKTHDLYQVIQYQVNDIIRDAAAPEESIESVYRKWDDLFLFLDSLTKFYRSNTNTQDEYELLLNLRDKVEKLREIHS